MATENRGVMVYLPPEIEEYITNFCTEYNITRKDKEGNILPSLGTGVVTYLKSKISGESPDEILTKPSKSLGNGLTRDEVLDLLRESNTSLAIGNGVSIGLSKDEVLELIKSEALTPITQLVEGLRAELAEVSEFARNLQGEVVKVISPDRVDTDEIPSNGNNPHPDRIGLFDGNSIPADRSDDRSSNPIPNPPKETGNGLTKDVRRWLKWLEEEGFRVVIEEGITNNWSDREIVDRLLAAGYGKNENTQAYPATLVGAMKKAYHYQLKQP